MFRRSALFVAFLWVCFTLTAISAAATPPIVKGLRTPNGGIQPDALAADGVVHLLYYSGEAAHGDLYYVRSSDDGGTWSQPLRVNSEPGSAVALGTIRGGQMALGRNGRVYVVWNGSSKTESEGPMNPESGKRGMPLLYTRLDSSHTAFEPQRGLMTRTFGLDGGGTVAADPAGNVYVAWHGKAPGAPAGEAGREVWIAKSTDDGQTFSAERPATSDPTGACGCCGMALYSNSKGAVYALYRSAREDVHRDIYLLTSIDHGKSFIDRDLHAWNIDACPMSSMRFTEGPKGVEAAWETGGQVYFQNISEPATKPVAATGSPGRYKHPRLSIDSAGQTLLVWADGTGWGRGGFVGWQIYSPEGTPVTGERGGFTNLPAWSFATTVAIRHGFLIIY